MEGKGRRRGREEEGWGCCRDVEIGRKQEGEPERSFEAQRGMK